MHNHDFLLIGTYAEGTALEPEAVRAQEAIDNCLTCAEEFELQTLALEALAHAEPARMSELERSRMHRAVQHATAEPRSVPQRSSRISSLMPKLAIAAVGVAIVGFVGSQTFSSLGTSDESADFGAATTAEGLPESADGVVERPAADAASEPELEMAEAFTEEEAQVEMLADEVGGAESTRTAPSDDQVLMSVDGLGLPDDLSAEQSAPGALRPVSLSSLDGAVLTVLNEPVPFVCVGVATETFGFEGPLDVAGLGVLNGVEIEVFSFGGSAHAFERATCLVVQVDVNLDS